jgi:hypothetical protein
MRSFRFFTAVPITAAPALLALLLLSPATSAHAQMPAYLHAISDLRTAREYLQQDTRPRFDGIRRHAIDEISRAIDDMKKAAIDDGKNPNHTPPPQSEGDPRVPVRSALKLLNEAYGDVARGQDEPRNAGLQRRSLEHIDKARRSLDEMIR